MPVAGPNKDASDREAEALLEEIMQFLKSKHIVAPTSTPSISPMIYNNLKKSWDEGQEQFLNALKELVWVNHCECW